MQRILRCSGFIAITALLAGGCAIAPQPDYQYRESDQASASCITSTGSRLPRPAGECIPVAGRSYSREQMMGTGALTAADALASLDPALQ